MQLANPLSYPIAVLAGGAVLVVGVRAIQLPSIVALPTAAVIATAGASWLKSREDSCIQIKPELKREIQTALSSAQLLTDKANSLRLEAAKILNNSSQMELLVAVQYACDRVCELPVKINQLSARIQGNDSLLSVDDLQQQLAEVQTKIQASSGVAKEHLNQLAQSIQRNILLAQQGQNARIAQIVNLSTLVQDSAGVLQELQNKLCQANLTDSTQIIQLRSLSDELSSFQQNVDLLVSK